MRTEVPYDSFWDELRKAVRRGGPFEINARPNNSRFGNIVATTQASFAPVTYTSSSAHVLLMNDYGSVTRRPFDEAGLLSANNPLLKERLKSMRAPTMRKPVPDDSPFAKCPACGSNVAPDLVYCNTCGKEMPE